MLTLHWPILTLSHLLTALDDAAAEVATGFWVDHSGHMLLGHQICVKLLAALCLFPIASSTAEIVKVTRPQSKKVTKMVPHCQ